MTEHIWPPGIVERIKKEEKHLDIPIEALLTEPLFQQMYLEFQEYIYVNYPGCRISWMDLTMTPEVIPGASYQTAVMKWKPETKRCYFEGGTMDGQVRELEEIVDVFYVTTFLPIKRVNVRGRRRQYYYSGWDPDRHYWVYRLKGL